MDHQPSNIVQLLRALYPQSPRFIKELPVTMTTTNYIVAPETTAITVDVAADLGNARTVVLVNEAATGTTTEIAFPSAKTLRGAFSRKLFANRREAGDAWASLKSDEHIIERDGIETFVGRLAVESDLPVSSGRGSDKRYADGTTLDLLLTGICAALPKANIITARVTVMVPADLHDQLAPSVIRTLQATHKLGYNGRDVVIKITSVDVRREGEVAYKAIDGDKPSRVIIVDGGGRTINLALFKDGVYRDGGTIDNVGVETALDDLDDLLIGRGLRALHLEERIGLQAAMKAGEAYTIAHQQKRHRIDTLARGPLDAVARAAIREMETIAPLDAADAVYAVGGAAYECFFGALWKAEIGATLAKEPETRNAYGALEDMLGEKPKKARRR